MHSTPFYIDGLTMTVTGVAAVAVMALPPPSDVIIMNNGPG